MVNAETALHRFCARILGWRADREVAVEHAIRSIELATDYGAALVLLGETDLVPVRTRCIAARSVPSSRSSCATVTATSATSRRGPPPTRRAA